MLRRLCGGLLPALVGACTLVTSLDGTTGGLRPPNGAEAGIDGAIAGDASLDPNAETDGGRGADSGPDPGCVRRPAVVVDRTPAGSAGFTCDLANAIAVDGKSAGLDSNSGPFGSVAGEAVSSCFEARFDADLGARVVIHATAAQSACMGGCTGGCSGNPQLKVFAGPTTDNLEYLGLIVVDRDAGLEAYTLFRASADPARVVVVCRGTTASYVDPAVDAVSADCR